MNKIITFLKEVRVELSKVSWPTKDQTTGFTIAVVVMAMLMAVYLGALDFIYEFILNKLIF